MNFNHAVMYSLMLYATAFAAMCWLTPLAALSASRQGWSDDES
jgi:hypothetical protein